MDRVKGGNSLDACGKFIKYSIFIVNLILCLAGLAIVGLGIWSLLTLQNSEKVLDHNYGVISSAILLAFGCMLTLITFLGCCGAIKEVKCLLLTFFVIVLLITIVFIVAVVLLYKFRDQTEDILKKAMNETLQKSKDEMQDAWDHMQKDMDCFQKRMVPKVVERKKSQRHVLQEAPVSLCGLFRCVTQHGNLMEKPRHRCVGRTGKWWKCCGVTSYTDWLPKPPPKSCDCTTEEACDGHNHWKNGCETYLRDQITKLATPILAVVITVIVVLLLSLVFSCSLVLML